MKVLVLSLGTGNLISAEETTRLKEINDEMKKTDEERSYFKELLEGEKRGEIYAYRTAKYRYGEEVIKSPFVAESLIKSYQPDRIVLIGTVKSCWSSFYVKFAPEANIEDFWILYSQEQNVNHGIHTGVDELDELEQTINEILQSSIHIKNERSTGNVEIFSRLIQYGMNEDELNLNYKRLRNLWRKITGDETNEDQVVNVAFDITHSFRSLPLYNLILMHYFSNVSKNKIVIDHVFYGNLDVARENDGIAEIVDLKDLIAVLNLISGVSEFENTGSSRTLELSLKGENENGLQKQLNEFDLATIIKISVHMTHTGGPIPPVYM